MPELARASREVIKTAARGLDAVQLRESLIEPLRDLMDVGPVFVAAADPVTWLLTGGSSADISADASSRFLANEYGQADVVKFADVAAAKHPVQSLHGATDDAPGSSPRWRDILEPLGWGDELRVALRDRSGVWGFLCLHRQRDGRSFSPADTERLAQVLPDITAAFRRVAAATVPRPRSAAGPGVILLRADLSIEAVTGSAAELIEELRATSPGQDLPLPLAALAARLLSEQRPQRLTTYTRSAGWITLHAGLMDGPGPARVAVVIEPPSASTVLPLFAATAGLTPRETQVVAALLRGQSTRLTAKSLQVSELTLQSQIRTVLGKAGVHSRAELVARLLGNS